MIVLHVARARTDSINIRGSFGKTQAALWITGATFLYFSGCPYPFHSLSLLSFFSLSLSLSLSLSVFYALSVSIAFLPRLSFTRPSSSYASLFHHITNFLSLSYTPLYFSLPPFLYLNLCFSLPFSLSLSIYLHPRSWPFNGTSRDSSLPRSELLPSRLKWKLLRCPIPDCRPCETKLPDNPLICPVITSHSRFDTAGLAGIAQVGSLKSPTSRH